MQQIIKGRGSLNGRNVADLMARCGMKRPLLVSGSRMQQVFAARTGLELPVFSGYHPNPDLVDCTAGADMYRDLGCDGLISLGGGSAMDTAKGVKAMLCCADMDAVKNSRLTCGEAVPHIAIPGTAGTGAEATPIAVTYVAGQKLSLDHPALLPEGILLDGSLLDTLPDDHRKACALDALSQGIESFWAMKATEESRVHAQRAIRGVLSHVTAYLAGDRDAQDAMLTAAYESGCAIRISRTTAAHAMSYQITKRIGYAHGHACLLTLPHLWAHLEASGGAEATLAALKSCMGLPEDADVPALLLGMLADMALLPDAAPDDDLLDVLASSVNAQRLGNHPEPLTQETLRALYARALRPIPAEERAQLAERWRAYVR